MKQFYLLIAGLTLATAGLFYQKGLDENEVSENKLIVDKKSSTVSKEPNLLPYSPVLRKSSAAKMSAPGITASMSYVITQDGGFTGASAGDELEYTVTITNSGTDATGVIFTDQIDPNTTLVPGSLKGGPIAINDAYSAIGNVGLDIPASAGVMQNDISIENTALVITSSTNITTAQGGTVVLNLTTGAFTYNPKAGYTGTDTFTYTIQNTSGLTASATVTITIAGAIWFVDDNAVAGGTGTLASPFNSIAALNSVNDGAALHPATNQTIFLYEGAYTAQPLTLLAGQKLIGQGAPESLLTLSGYTTPSGNNTLPATNGTRPEITSSANAVVLNSGNSVRGLNIGNSTGKKISGSNFGTLTVKDVALTGTGQALDLAAGQLAANFSNISSTVTGAVKAVNITSANGSLTIGTGTISSGAASAILISGKGIADRLTLDATFLSVSVNGADRGISVSNTSGTFAVTGSGSTGGSGGTIQNISARGLEFVNADGISVKNLNLTNANTTDGTDPVAGNNLNANAAIFASNVNGLTLQNIPVTGTVSQEGINMNAVRNFSLTSVSVAAAGNEVEEGAIYAVNSLGTCTITNSTFSTSPLGKVAYLRNTNSNILTLLTVDNSTFQNATNGSGIQVEGYDTSKMSVKIQNNSQFLNCQTTGVEVYANDDSDLNFEIKNSTVNPGATVGTGVDIASSGTSTVKFNVLNNTMSANGGPVVNLFPNDRGYLEGTVDGNTLSQLSGSGSGIAFDSQGITANGVIKISNNTISDVGGSGIKLYHASTSAATSHFTITGNAINLTTANSLYNIDLNMPAGVGNVGTGCANIASNSVTGIGSSGMLRVRATTSNTITLAGAGATVASNWLSQSNTGAGAISESGTITYGATCTVPNVSSLRISAEENARVASDETKAEVSPKSGATQAAVQETEVKAVASRSVKTDSSARKAGSLSGETVTVDGDGSGFSLPAGQSVTIKFRVTVDNNIPASDCELQNQGSVAADGIIAVLTDDPSVGGTADMTSTPLATAPAITCPTDIITDADAGKCTAALSPVPTFTGCPSPTLTYKIGATTITFPYEFPVGETQVDVSADNGNGPAAQCSFKVTVNPIISLVGYTCSEDGTTYRVTFNAVSGAVIATDKGTVSGNTVSGIPSNETATITATLGGSCAPGQLIVTQNCTLPVTISSFTGKLEESAVALEWKTTSETMSDRFEVERSEEGKIWHLLGSVKSNGESVIQRTYHFRDMTPVIGQNLYRLKMIDTDGSYAYSRLVAIRIRSADSEAVKIYPNPVSDILNLKLSDWSEVASVKIFNNAGRVVYQSEQQPSNAISMKQLPAGVYILKIKKRTGQTTTHKIVVGR